MPNMITASDDEWNDEIHRLTPSPPHSADGSAVEATKRDAAALIRRLEERVTTKV
jgi:hypothetical protein